MIDWRIPSVPAFERAPLVYGSLVERDEREMTHATDIVAYTFQADTYCQGCIVDQLPTGDGEAFDGWNPASGATMSTEENLSEIAAAFGINRMDERSFDSGDFPKVVFSSQVEGPEHCGACNELID